MKYLLFPITVLFILLSPSVSWGRVEGGKNLICHCINLFFPSFILLITLFKKNTNMLEQEKTRYSAKLLSLWDSS